MKILTSFIFITSILLIPLYASANEASATPTFMTTVQFTSDADTNVQTTQLQPLVKISNQSELTFLETIDLSPHLIPVGITYDPSTGNTYVANSADHTISVIDGNTNQVTDTIVLDKTSPNFSYAGPIGIVFDPHKHVVYAVNAPYGMVSVVNVKTHKVTDIINLGGDLTWTAIDVKGKQVFVVNSDLHTISVISTNTQKLIDTIHLSYLPWSASFNNNDGNLYVTLLTGNSVQVIDGKTHMILNTINLANQGSPKFVAFDNKGEHAYVTCGYSSVVVIDTKSAQVISTITMPDLPYGGYYDKAGKFVVFNNYSEVLKSNREKLTADPYNLVFDPDNGNMYVLNYGMGVLSVIDTKNMTLTGYIATPPSGNGAVYNEKNKIIYLTNESVGTVSLIGNAG